MNNLDKLFKWPETKPTVPPDSHGWLCDENKQILKRYITDDVKTIVELGSWLGLSARFILDNALHANLIAIDHWSSTLVGHDNGGTTDPMFDSSIEKISTLWETFLVNCWDYKDRLYPVRAYTKDGLIMVNKLNIKVDLVYIDASHSYEDVLQDITLSKQFWPNAKIIGDDYGWNGVITAVHEYAEKNKLQVEHIGNCWHYL